MNSLSGLTVLIVDDDADARELTAMILASAGARVDEAGSGGEALEKASQDRFDVIVSDIAMPEMDGVTLLRELRARRLPSSEARVLAFTAFVSKDDRDDALEAGFDQHLGKTADASRLIDTVGQLGRREVAQAS